MFAETSLKTINAALAREDVDVLKSFYIHKYQTLGDILTLNAGNGSDIVVALEKLIDFGFIRRDRRKEVQSHEDIIYSITDQGIEAMEKG